MSEVKTNKITSGSSNNDITLDPDGTGKVANQRPQTMTPWSVAQRHQKVFIGWLTLTSFLISADIGRALTIFVHSCDI